MNEISDNKQIFCSPDNFPSLIRGIIADLRSIIDQIGTNLKSAKELIIELAKRLYEEKICEKCKISSLVKYLLRDKITEGKITARWVEGCLPDDYKRNYTKCEENSHLKKTRKLQEILVDNSGRIHAESILPNDSSKEYANEAQKEQVGSEGDGACPGCQELKEALSKTTLIQSAKDLGEREIRISVSKDKYEQLRSVMEQNSEFFHIIIDKTTWSLVRAEQEYTT